MFSRKEFSQRYLCLDDFERAAAKRLPGPIYAYISGGTETNSALKDNQKVFEEILFVPRVLNDVSGRSTAVRIMGTDYAAPFGIAPMGICGLSAYEGDLVLARSAARHRIPMVMSGSSLIRLEELAQSTPANWFQAYLPFGWARIEKLIDRVRLAGFETLVVTVDCAILPNRENNIRAGFSTPLRPSWALVAQGLTHPTWLGATFLKTLWHRGLPHFENNDAQSRTPIVAKDVLRDFRGREALDWSEIGRVRDFWRGKLVLKGILSAVDVQKARELGADAIILSNHGGRQLDGATSAMRMLPAAVAAAGPMPVMVDGGFRRGTDVLKALALGAKFVFVGRPFNYAMAVSGLEGASHAIQLLMNEIHVSMGLLGVTDLGQIGSEYLRFTNARDWAAV